MERMSKAVMLRVRPKWCEKIARGEKTIEVRKTRPKLDTPFRCYIYRTKGIVPHIINGKWVKMEVGGTVIGEFTCDAITRVNIYGFWDDSGKQLDNQRKETCLTSEELCNYLGENVGYGWHISDLVIYDKPKELSEFKGPCKIDADCCACPHYNYTKMDCDGRKIKRPPQSWCYVEKTRRADNG